MKRIPSVSVVMTPFPWSVGLDGTVANARALMEEHGIRHLPVTLGDDPVGLLNSRDIAQVDDAGPVSDIYRQDAMIVDLHARLDQVVLELADRRDDCALVTRQGRLVGILTASDLFRFLAELLQKPFVPPSDDGDVA